MDAHRCVTGEMDVVEVLGVVSSENARRATCNRGGMALDMLLLVVMRDFTNSECQAFNAADLTRLRRRCLATSKLGRPPQAPHPPGHATGTYGEDYINSRQMTRTLHDTEVQRQTYCRCTQTQPTFHQDLVDPVGRKTSNANATRIRGPLEIG